MTHPSPAELVAYAARQTAAFHTALAAAVAEYDETGVAPAIVTAAGGAPALAAAATPDAGGKKKRSKKDKDAPKRPPTPYNIYVKERAAALKAQGFDPKAQGTTLMNRCASEWKAMPPADKDKFIHDAIAKGKAVAPGGGKAAAAEFAAAHAAPPALPDATTPAGGGGSGGDAAADEERRRRKAEKRARKEAAKAAALAAGGEPAAKKQKHKHAE